MSQGGFHNRSEICPLCRPIAERGAKAVDGDVIAVSRRSSSANAISVRRLRLGIGIERIKPGNPQQNGRHERMHLTLKKEATRPAGRNFLQQQAKFDDFMHCYNFERLHQALGMKYPAERYTEKIWREFYALRLGFLRPRDRPGRVRR